MDDGAPAACAAHQHTTHDTRHTRPHARTPHGGAQGYAPTAGQTCPTPPCPAPSPSCGCGRSAGCGCAAPAALVRLLVPRSDARGTQLRAAHARARAAEPASPSRVPHVSCHCWSRRHHSHPRRRPHRRCRCPRPHCRRRGWRRCVVRPRLGVVVVHRAAVEQPRRLRQLCRRHRRCRRYRRRPCAHQHRLPPPPQTRHSGAEGPTHEHKCRRTVSTQGRVGGGSTMGEPRHRCTTHVRIVAIVARAAVAATPALLLLLVLALLAGCTLRTGARVRVLRALPPHAHRSAAARIRAGGACVRSGGGTSGTVPASCGGGACAAPSVPRPAAVACQTPHRSPRAVRTGCAITDARCVHGRGTKHMHQTRSVTAVEWATRVIRAGKGRQAAGGARTRQSRRSQGTACQTPVPRNTSTRAPQHTSFAVRPGQATGTTPRAHAQRRQRT